MLSNIKGWELLVIVAVVVLLFGAKKLPDMARSLGKSARILKSEAKAMKNDGSTPGAAQEQAAPKTIKAAPGDTASSRPVEERSTTTG
ncbi:Sec-independent protein translocase subunit TatA [Streptomyces sp. NPDC021020]|uniref:Sec-independent protein translocase subunit TatA n=1 Tax=Streptomyces sp. NPDC021020 TaxID=3365109 RepID=UPI0037AB67E0